MTRLPIQSLLLKAIDALDSVSIPWVIMGGFAVRAWGIPRPTYDADLAVAARDDQLAGVLDALERAGFDVPPEHRKGYVDSVGGMPKLKVTCFVENSVWEVDLFLARGGLLESALSRRRSMTMEGRSVWVIAPEDLILLKLAANRRKDQLDVEEILRVTPDVDAAYLRSWASKLGVAGRLEEFLRERA